MLNDLENLNLHHASRVPTSYAGRLAAIKQLVESVPGISRQLDQLKVRIKIGALLDALFEIQDVLLATQRRRFWPQAG